MTGTSRDVDLLDFRWHFLFFPSIPCRLGEFFPFPEVSCSARCRHAPYGFASILRQDHPWMGSLITIGSSCNGTVAPWIKLNAGKSIPISACPCSRVKPLGFLLAGLAARTVTFFCGFRALQHHPANLPPQPCCTDLLRAASPASEPLSAAGILGVFPCKSHDGQRYHFPLQTAKDIQRSLLANSQFPGLSQQ
jgi:hypothetical protein